MIIDFNRYNGGGGSGSGVTPQDVQAQINSALTPYWDSGETKDYVDGAVSGISLNGYYTSAQTEEAIAEAVEGYATSGDMQSAFTLISETQQVAAAGLNQLEGRIDELSAATPSVDLSGYYTSAQTEDAISAATAGKADKASISPNSNAQVFPAWNEQGIITGTSYANSYNAVAFRINGVMNVALRAGAYKDFPSIYAPESAGTAGDILVSTGNGAPVWSAVTFPDVSNYVTSAQTDAAISAATAGKADAANVTPNGFMSFPKWNEQGVITGTTGNNLTRTGFFLNGIPRYLIKEAASGDLGDLYGPTTPGTAGQILVSAGNGAPVWTNDNKVSSTSVSTIWKGTQAEYDAIATKDPNTFYIIVNN